MPLLKTRLEKLLRLAVASKIMIFDKLGIAERIDLSSFLENKGFSLHRYDNVERFRIIYEESLKTNTDRTAVIVTDRMFVPYDILMKFYTADLTAEALFPNLNPGVSLKYILDWDIISFAYQNCYSDYSLEYRTERYISASVFSSENIERYCMAKIIELRAICGAAKSYAEWIHAAKVKASALYYTAMGNIGVDLSFADQMFREFIYNGYSRLFSEIGCVYPPIVTKTLSFISALRNEKTAIIIMDGMSLFDFEVISRFFDGISYEHNATFALIPTTTPVSRQSLLSGKYPQELTKPLSLVDEEKEFRRKAASLGFQSRQVEYLRGYDSNISPLTKLAAVIINEVDDIVHGQRQGRAGMYNDMKLLGKSGKLQSLISQLVKQRFTVYITADHGNTPCIGVGSIRAGVEVESRSKRMFVLKDFADISPTLSENTFEYPGYYLSKDYRYLICKTGVSFDTKGESVLAHGGISLDEVIVPFITIKGVR